MSLKDVTFAEENVTEHDNISGVCASVHITEDLQKLHIFYIYYCGVQ